MNLLPVFSSGSFIVSVLTFKSLIHEYIFVYGIRVQLHYFACVYPIFPLNIGLPVVFFLLGFVFLLCVAYMILVH